MTDLVLVWVVVLGGVLLCAALGAFLAARRDR
jgi:hypothetical protein